MFFALFARLRHTLSGGLIHTLAPADVWPDAARMAVAGIATFMLSRALHLQGGYFAVLIALMTTRPSSNGMKGVVDRILGMALGVGVGLALSFLRHWRVPLEVLVALAMVPLCFVVARFRKYQAAPIAAMVVLSGASSVSHALEGAGMRMLEVGMGAAIGLVVAAIVFRRSVDARSRRHAGDALRGCGALMVAATIGGPARRDAALRARIRGDLRLVMATGRVLRTRGPKLGLAHIAGLNRLQSDLLFYGRALAETRRPWRRAAAPVLERLADSFHTVCGGAAGYLLGDLPAPEFHSLDGAILALRALAAAGSNDASVALPFLVQRLRADLADLLDAYAPPGEMLPDEDGELTIEVLPVRALARG